jgi:hypothetical protein
MMLLALSAISCGKSGSLFGPQLGRDTYYCESGEVEFSDINLDVPLKPVLNLTGTCHVTLRRCNLRAPIVANIGMQSRLTVEGGRLEGTMFAIQAGGTSIAEIKGAAIEGPFGSVFLNEDAKLIGLPPEHPAMIGQQQQHDRIYARGLCHYLPDCHLTAGEFGNVQGRVIVLLRPGAVESTRIEGKDISDKVRECMVKTTSKWRLDPAIRTPAEVTCEYAGTIMKTSRRLSENASMRRLTALPDSGGGRQ